MGDRRQDSSSNDDESDEKDYELKDWGSSRSLTGGAGWDSDRPRHGE